MNRFSRALVLLLWFDLGVLLVLIPWSNLWESNYFLSRYPGLLPFLLNPYVRGAVTGLGLADMVMAAGSLFRRPPRRTAVVSQN
jgi:hypothetical protein